LANFWELLKDVGSLVVKGAPDPEAQQFAGTLSENNPYRARFQNMTGIPTLQARNLASNWEQADTARQQWQDQFNLQKEKYLSDTIDMTPELIQQFSGYSPENFNAKLLSALGPGRRDIGTVQKVYETEGTLRQKTQIRDTLYKSAQDLINTLPESPRKNALNQTLPLLQLPGMEGEYGNIAKEVMAAMPQEMTQEQKLKLEEMQLKLQKAQAEIETEQAQAANYRSMIGNRGTTTGLDTEYKTLRNRKLLKSLEEGDEEEKPPTRKEVIENNYNQLSGMASRYKRKEDYLADLRRYRARIVQAIGPKYYNELVAAVNGPMLKSVYGSQFISGSKSPMEKYINEAKARGVWDYNAKK
jgi:hypothetical protein